MHRLTRLEVLSRALSARAAAGLCWDDESAFCFLDPESREFEKRLSKLLDGAQCTKDHRTLYRWIVWSLASYERHCPESYYCMLLQPEVVAHVLQRRYQRFKHVRYVCVALAMSL